MKTLIHARREPWDFDITLLIGQRDEQGNLYVMRPAVFEKREPGMPTEPAMRLPLEGAQLLMDELWDAGLRPSEGTGSAGAMAAVQRHLDDMRAIVRKQGVMDA